MGDVLVDDWMVSELSSDEWNRVKNLRLASLRDSAAAFDGNYDLERLFIEPQWRAKFEKLKYLVASVSAVDVGIMAIKDFDLEFDATCWVGGCWTDPKFRGKGLLRAMFAYVDENADRNNWTVQGLDVWTDNEVAIRAFKAVGFVQAGESIASTRHSGKHYMRMIRKL